MAYLCARTQVASAVGTFLEIPSLLHGTVVEEIKIYYNNIFVNKLLWEK